MDINYWLEIQNDVTVRKRLAKLMAKQCFRNTKLEDFHAELRYSQKFLNNNNLELKPKVTGSKVDIHQWQHEKILNYKQNNNGQRPTLNKSDW